jgi:superfamily II DNA or RNA helicase
MLLQKTMPGFSSTQESFTLRPYQQDCVEATLYAYFCGDRRKGLIEIPTGGGKTISALNTLYRLREVDHQTTGLLIAPTIDLALKNFTESQRFFPREEVGLVQAENRLYQHPIVVATTDTLANPATRRKLLWAQGGKKFSFVWIDEMHVKSLGILKYILEDLEEDYALRLAVSATPYRGDGRSLEPVCPDGLFYNIEISELVAEDWLLPFQIHKVVTTEKNRKQDALAYWRESCGQAQSILFARSVADAQGFNRHFRKNGVTSEVLSASVGVERRDKIYREFRRGSLSWMQNWGVLTTGVDFPCAKFAFIARPAWMKGKLSGIHRQAVGRIIRLLEGKSVGGIVYLTTPEYDWTPTLEELSGADGLATL